MHFKNLENIVKKLAKTDESRKYIASYAIGSISSYATSFLALLYAKNNGYGPEAEAAITLATKGITFGAAHVTAYLYFHRQDYSKIKNKFSDGTKLILSGVPMGMLNGGLKGMLHYTLRISGLEAEWAYIIGYASAGAACAIGKGIIDHKNDLLFRKKDQESSN